MTECNITYKKPVFLEREKGNARNDRIDAIVAASSRISEPANQVNYSSEDSPEVAELKHRDSKLRQNAVAHGTSLAYQTGPDGHIYIAGRKVSLEALEVPNNPEATIDKALEIRRAVNSQNEPSLHDLHLLITASNMEKRARAELMRMHRESRGEKISIVDKYV
jgi:hypothetical protein